MYRFLPQLRLGTVLGILLFATTASAALPPAFYNNFNTQSDCTNPAQPCGTSDKVITFYVPHSGVNCATSLQGCIATSKKGLDGKNDPISVDAVRLGKAKYATCASDSSNYGKYYNVGTVKYRSALDQDMYSVPNVICYVHDTGGAFTGRPQKLDLATTLCPTCTEAEASAIGRGAAVTIAGIGPADIAKQATNWGAVNIGTPTGIGGGQVVAQDSYCITSIDPVVVVPVPAGTRFPSNCYNSPPAGSGLAQRPPPAPMSQPVQQVTQAAQNVGQQISQFFFGAQSTSTPAITPAALLIVQPQTVSRGNPIVVSWSSVGMSTKTPCQVSQNSTSVSQSNAGSQVIQTRALAAGTLTFTLTCTTQTGAQVQQSANVTVN